MIRPTLEVADIIRAQGERFIARTRSWLTWPQRKVLHAIARCRTAALGGHRDRCVRCGHRTISYNSCRNRHGPKCQIGARNRWLAERSKELLPVRYVHVVFTLPHQLDHLIVLGEGHLRRILKSHLEYYHRSRTPLGLGKETPQPRAVQPPGLGEIVEFPQVGGLHHRDERRVA